MNGMARPLECGESRFGFSRSALPGKNERFVDGIGARMETGSPSRRAGGIRKMLMAAAGRCFRWVSLVKRLAPTEESGNRLLFGFDDVFDHDQPHQIGDRSQS